MGCPLAMLNSDQNPFTSQANVPKLARMSKRRHF